MGIIENAQVGVADHITDLIIYATPTPTTLPAQLSSRSITGVAIARPRREVLTLIAANSIAPSVVRAVDATDTLAEAVDEAVRLAEDEWESEVRLCTDRYNGFTDIVKKDLVDYLTAVTRLTTTAYWGVIKQIEATLEADDWTLED